MKSELDQESIYHMREEIIRMQGYINRVDPNTTHSTVKDLVAKLNDIRSVLEELMAL